MGKLHSAVNGTVSRLMQSSVSPVSGLLREYYLCLELVKDLVKIL